MGNESLGLGVPVDVHDLSWKGDHARLLVGLSLPGRDKVLEDHY